MDEKLKGGDRVCPKTKIGVLLAKTPLNGKWDQEREVTCTFKGEGTILDVLNTILYHDKLIYSNVYVRCDSGEVEGWTSAKALRKLK
jgi:hypothetical protein